MSKCAFLLVPSLLIAFAAPPSRAAAEDDTVYGRFRGDLVLSSALGGGIGFFDPARASDEVAGLVTAEFRARVIDSGGLVLAPEWRPDGTSRFIVAADLRPIFMMRFVSNAESGHRMLDLFVDSIGIDLGFAITPLNERVGAAFSLGFGFDVPFIFFDESADGLFLRASTRWTHAGVTDQLGPPEGMDDLTVTLLLGIRAGISTGIASHEPARYRVREP